MCFVSVVQNVLPVSKQLEYFAHYKIHLRREVGEERAEFITRNALYIMSMGTNDFLQNYFLEPTRPKQFSLEEFENFLLSRFSKDVQVFSFSIYTHQFLHFIYDKSWLKSYFKVEKLVQNFY